MWMDAEHPHPPSPSPCPRAFCTGDIPPARPQNHMRLRQYRRSILIDAAMAKLTWGSDGVVAAGSTSEGFEIFEITQYCRYRFILLRRHVLVAPTSMDDEGVIGPPLLGSAVRLLCVAGSPTCNILASATLVSSVSNSA